MSYFFGWYQCLLSLAIFAEIVIALFIVYVPFMHTIIATANIGWEAVAVGIPFLFGLILVDEVCYFSFYWSYLVSQVRKLLIRHSAFVRRMLAW